MKNVCSCLSFILAYTPCRTDQRYTVSVIKKIIKENQNLTFFLNLAIGKGSQQIYNFTTLNCKLYLKCLLCTNNSNFKQTRTKTSIDLDKCNKRGTFGERKRDRVGRYYRQEIEIKGK